MSRVLVAMSGGVDSSVAAALLLDAGHEVEGATMKLWGGESDSGCCSVSDVDDARRVAQQLGIVHHVFSFTDDFDRFVVDPYVADHVAGRVPNPCIECNRHLKLDRFLRRAQALGFDAIATGHHARVDHTDGRWHLRRGADAAKDQSYVLHVADQAVLSQLLLPVGSMTKPDVRAIAVERGLRTATKPDSQDVCFITASQGRRRFLEDRVPMHEAEVVEQDGRVVGTVPAVESVTVGQRRGLGDGIPTSGERRFVVAVDVPRRKVTMGPPEALLRDGVTFDTAPGRAVWPGGEPAPGTAVLVQTSAHGTPVPARYDGLGRVVFDAPARVVAAGQAVVLYSAADPSDCLGGGPAL